MNQDQEEPGVAALGPGENSTTGNVATIQGGGDAAGV